ncbi:probable cytochrome P450 6a21 [Limulus polyphemus]|uniref:Probable cytochrome P450 6a21 n=1 Tax=Limulus polyphemus TaxID=6850 RepID=A0ABM1SZR9_LIMPO|nr:probable cytochrome P450 6a21 [Limulus polyphemus]
MEQLVLLLVTPHIYWCNILKCRKKIRQEVDELVEKEGENLDYVSVHKLRYLDQVFSESLRVYPPVYLFSPDNHNRNPLAWQPFGYGPRNCIGMRFAQLEAKMTLAKMVQKYFLRPCEKTEKKRRNDLLQLMIDSQNINVDVRKVTGSQLTAGDETHKSIPVASSKSGLTDDEVVYNAFLALIAG